MKYIGLDRQIRRNNFNSILLLFAFPALLLVMCYAIIYFSTQYGGDEGGGFTNLDPNSAFISTVPFVLIGVAIGFLIAWLAHASFIPLATGGKPLERKENKRVYNLVENLCISRRKKMPTVNNIEDDSLNALASRIDEKSYSVTLSRGIINKL